MHVRMISIRRVFLKTTLCAIEHSLFVFCFAFWLTNPVIWVKLCPNAIVQNVPSRVYSEAVHDKQNMEPYDYRSSSSMKSDIRAHTYRSYL